MMWFRCCRREGVLICFCLDGMGQKGAGVSLHVERFILPVLFPDGLDKGLLRLIARGITAEVLFGVL